MTAALPQQIKTRSMCSEVTATGAQTGVPTLANSDGVYTYTALVTSVSGSAAISVQGSDDNTNWITFATLAPDKGGANGGIDAVTAIHAFPYTRYNFTAVTGATVSGNMNQGGVV